MPECFYELSKEIKDIIDKTTKINKLDDITFINKLTLNSIKC